MFMISSAISDVALVFYRTLAGAVVNVPSIDSSGDIHQFCQNVKQLCIQKGVEIKTNCEVKEILTQNDPDTNRYVIPRLLSMYLDCIH